MTNHDVVVKLIGKIRPVGESNEDAERLKNLDEMCRLVESLLCDIDDMISSNKDDKQASVKRAVDYGRHFMKTTVGEFINNPS